MSEQFEPRSPLRSPLGYQSMRPSELSHDLEMPTVPWKSPVEAGTGSSEGTHSNRESSRQVSSAAGRQVAVLTPKITVNPVVHVATAVCPLGGVCQCRWHWTIRHHVRGACGLVTKLAVDVVDNVTEAAIVMQYVSFFLGSLLSGMLISSLQGVGMGTELYGIVLLLVSGLLLLGGRLPPRQPVAWHNACLRPLWHSRMACSQSMLTRSYAPPI